MQKGIITPDQLEQALARQRDGGGRLGDVLVAVQLADEEAVARALADEAAVPFVRLDDPPELGALFLVPAGFARERMLVPLAVTGSTLRIAPRNSLRSIEGSGRELRKNSRWPGSDPQTEEQSLTFGFDPQAGTGPGGRTYVK